MEIRQARSRLTVTAVQFFEKDIDAINKWLEDLRIPSCGYKVRDKKLQYVLPNEGYKIELDEGDYIVLNNNNVIVYSDITYRLLYEEIGTLSSTE